MYGPFLTFNDMMLNACERATYVQDAWAAVAVEALSETIDHGDASKVDNWWVIDRLAKQCGMVARQATFDWFYTLTE